MKYSEEQCQAIDLSLVSESLVIEAGAGAGKTSTLAGISSAFGATKKRGVYLSFNKAVADQAKSRFPTNVKSTTAHSMAFGQLESAFRARVGNLSLGVISSEFNESFGRFGAKFMKTLAIKTFDRFCLTMDDAPDERHVPDDVLERMLPSFVDQDEIDGVRMVAGIYANRLWQRMFEKDSTLPIPHNAYLKRWALSSPIIQADFILFDEFQDANPVMLHIYEMQKHAQRIGVGDRYQAIYGWNGAVNAMDSDAAARCRLTKSYRFGAKIAGLARRVVVNGYGHLFPVTGRDDVFDRIEMCANPSATICRGNAGVLDRIMARQEKGLKSYTPKVGGVVPKIKDLGRLMRGAQAETPEFSIYKNFAEVEEVARLEKVGELNLLLKLVKNHGPERLVSALSSAGEKSTDAEVVMTCHGAKGLEFERVFVYDDFFAAKINGVVPEEKREEVNLLYVAVTRAMLAVNDPYDQTGCIVAPDRISSKIGQL